MESLYHVQTFVYGDLYRYDVDNREWELVSSPNSPPPRSAHQSVAWKDHLYIFGNLLLSICFSQIDLLVIKLRLIFIVLIGGEFTSPNQERFHHYKVNKLIQCIPYVETEVHSCALPSGGVWGCSFFLLLHPSSLYLCCIKNILVSRRDFLVT